MYPQLDNYVLAEQDVKEIKKRFIARHYSSITVLLQFSKASELCAGCVLWFYYSSITVLLQFSKASELCAGCVSWVLLQFSKASELLCTLARLLIDTVT